MAQRKQFKSFSEMIQGSETPLLVDFYATWCGPCKLMAGILDQVKGQLGDNVSIVKIDTDKYPTIAAEWQVHALPTLILFKDGQPIDRIEGVVRPNDLVARLQQAAVV